MPLDLSLEWAHEVNPTDFHPLRMRMSTKNALNTDFGMTSECHQILKYGI